MCEGARRRGTHPPPALKPETGLAGLPAPGAKLEEGAVGVGGRARPGGGGGGTRGMVAVGTWREKRSAGGWEEGEGVREGEGERGGGGGIFRAAELVNDGGRLLVGGGGPDLLTRWPPCLLRLEVRES